MMKCSRVNLSDRSTVKLERVAKIKEDTPRHYCQRRLADSTHDEREWLKRYTPERFHLTIGGDSDESEGDSRPITPATLPETPEIFNIKTPKNVFRPAFLTVTNIDLPSAIKTTTAWSNTWLKRKAKYKTVPKHCSDHMHRMFVKNIEENVNSRTSSRASTEYDRDVFEQYLCQLVLPDDSSEILSLFDGDSQMRFGNREYDVEENASNNNDSRFINKNSNKPKKYISNSSTMTKSNGDGKNKDTIKKYNNNNIKNDNKSSIYGGNNTKSVNVNDKREKRKSITLSRVPSPETIQVIRIDVISGYPVDSESLLSEITDDFITSEDGSQLNADCTEKSNSDIDTRSKSISQALWQTNSLIKPVGRSEDVRNSFSPLYCKSLNLTSRF